LDPKAMGDMIFVDIARFDEELADLLPGRPLPGQRPVELFPGNPAGGDENLAQAETRRRGFAGLVPLKRQDGI
jgi:hypothetical protein